MTENNLVSGEGATIAAVPEEAFREMYSRTARATRFLECLRCCCP